MSRPHSPWEVMSDELAADLVAAGGDARRESMALARALARYARARLHLSEPPWEYAVHFFGSDGAAPDEVVKPALQRPAAGPEATARWLRILTELPRRLDLLDDLAAGAGESGPAQ